MKRKFIDITSGHKLHSGEYITWVKSIPAHNFTFINVNGVQFAAIERNYYLDQKTNTIRYQSHNCDNASYDHLYTLYAEVYPGIFAYAGVATEYSLTEKMERQALHFNALEAETIEIFRNSLIRYGA